MKRFLFGNKFNWIFFFAVFLGLMTFSMKSMAFVEYTIHYQDEAGNSLCPSTTGRIEAPGRIELESTLTASLYNQGEAYYLKPVQPLLSEKYNYNAASAGADLYVEGDSSQYTLIYALPQVSPPATPSMPATPSTPPSSMIDYIIEFVDESGHKLIPDLTGKAPNMTWLSLVKEFDSTLYDPGSRYMIRVEQVYDSSRYIYGYDTKVLISGSYMKYVLVCYKKVETPPVIRSGSSGGGGSAPKDSSAVFKEGWILDGNTWTYYAGKSRTALKKGWHKDPQDGFWYYLDSGSGRMRTGWSLIDGKWYFFNEHTPMWTWEQHSDGEWYFKKIPGSRPLGSMYKNEKTPDGSAVDDKGSWIEN